ncbi:5'-nucleotidase domain-containing protein 1 isoform X2 [Orussus abietinus]|uniref:5'-nucleotidase domain-containing protein 1 isoform X2 n=1 Tax=Orussus abietinus TaxID=222816 RepID=UPI000625AB0A|nr:5'-nucleotidase domain-containing protein 1 isoform X2 [Orussus abietinus]
MFLHFNKLASRYSCKSVNLVKQLNNIDKWAKALNNYSVVHFVSTANMNVMKFSDYDCIGFDLDNTLLRYNVTNLVHFEYDTLAKYMVEKKGYSAKHLLKPLDTADLDFMQKGLMMDFEKGNILKVTCDGSIQRATHGSKLLNMEDIESIYPNKRWHVIDSFCNDMLSTWNGPMSMQMRPLLDYFDMPSSLIFARAVDAQDEKGIPQDCYRIWPDMLEGLIEMYNKDHFQSGQGNFFSAIKSNPKKYIHKCSPRTISWLQDLKKKQKIFLITGSNIDFANFTASYAFGDDWKSLFDIIICYAKKPGFFTSNRPFLTLLDYKESGPISGKNLQQGGTYSQGNWKDLYEFFTCITGKIEPRCLYIGDNLVQDIYVPSACTTCDVIAVVDEQISEDENCTYNQGSAKTTFISSPKATTQYL